MLCCDPVVTEDQYRRRGQTAAADLTITTHQRLLLERLVTLLLRTALGVTTILLCIYKVIPIPSAPRHSVKKIVVGLKKRYLR